MSVEHNVFGFRRAKDDNARRLGVLEEHEGRTVGPGLNDGGHSNTHLVLDRVPLKMGALHQLRRSHAKAQERDSARNNGVRRQSDESYVLGRHQKS